MRKAIIPLIIIILTVFLGCYTMNQEYMPASTPGSLLTSAPTTTLTPFSTITATVVPTNYNTPTIEPTLLAEVETLEAIVEEHAELKQYNDPRYCLIYGICSYSYGHRLSPNKEWATFFIADKTYGIDIIGIENNKEWKIYFHDLWPYEPPYGEGMVFIEHWSRDGKYLYLTYTDGSEGGYGYFWETADKLFRFNLDNGTWVDTKMGPAHAISPNDKYISYRRGQELVIYEFQTGDERVLTIPDEFIVFSNFQWSPDSSKLIFITSNNDFMQDEIPTGLNLVLLNIDTMHQETILENDNRFFYPVEWISDDQVALCIETSMFSLYHMESLVGAYLLDLSDNTIEKFDYPNSAKNCYY